MASYKDILQKNISPEELDKKNFEEKEQQDFEEMKQKFYMKITAVLETYDHDGYCSSDECEYKKTNKKVYIDIPNQSMLCPDKWLKYNWKKHLPKPKLNIEGSGFCRGTHEKSNGLDNHDYRYTIKKIEIVKK